MRFFIRSLFIVVVLVVAGFVLLGSWNGTSWRRATGPETKAVGTSGSVDTQKARQMGAELGEKAAIATQQMKESAHDATITTKIKAKMALDELVKARTIDVSTDGSTVILTGSVGSDAERQRAVALARETAGVTTVFDRLIIR